MDTDTVHRKSFKNFVIELWYNSDFKEKIRKKCLKKTIKNYNWKEKEETLPKIYEKI